MSKMVSLVSTALSAFLVGALVVIVSSSLNDTSEAKASLIHPTEVTPVVTKLPSVPYVHVEPLPKRYTSEDLDCMARNIYFEARNESRAGMAAVAQVVMNRVEDPRFPSTPCEVIYQAQVSQWHLKNTGKVVPLRNKCQFSWYCDGKEDHINYASPAWAESYAVAEEVLSGDHTDLVAGADHYHADYVKPRWRRSMTHVVTIDTHIFYRSK